jgi:cellulose synthase/poly-beta-1,6-N-acetylglucosamine synthase-like glycosyltransferase
MRLHRHMREAGRPYRITFAPDPVCWTEAPADIATLGSQRRRWHRGLWESIWRHRSMMLRRRYGAVGMLALPYCLVFEFASPLMEAAAWIAFPIGIGLGVIDVEIVFAYIVVAWLFGTVITLIACGLEERGYRHYRRGRDLGRMFVAAVFENMWFRQLVDLYRLQGIWDLARRRDGWGTMKRRGFETT